MSEGSGNIISNIGGNVSGPVAVGIGNTQVSSVGRSGQQAYAPEVDVKVFISYRRDDADGHAGRLRDWLARRLGDDHVFLDVAGIDPGEDFVDKLNRKVGECDVLLAVIGKHWLTVTDSNGRRRLDNAEDWVRLEIQVALERNITVVPVLVSGASMPAAADLPEPIAALARRHAIELGPEWRSDVERLGDVIERVARARQDALGRA
jgi:hypothetical protein